MSINTDSCVRVACRRQPFTLRPNPTDGTLLLVHHVINQRPVNQTIRFLHVTFNTTSALFAALNHLGNIYVFDFTIMKYWFLVHENCSLIKFILMNETNETDLLLVGTTTADVHIFNAQTARIVSELRGHKFPVTDASFSEDQQCVTLSTCEAIVWCLQTFTKMQMLHLEHGVLLKLVMFVPATNDLVACFQDETIQMWKGRLYTPVVQIVPKQMSGTFSKLVVRSIAFTRNGKLMAVVGNSSCIYIFMTETFSLKKQFCLNDPHISMKKAQFLPNLFDDGVNKILALLTTGGVAYFYHMENGQIIREISEEQEIWKFSLDNHGNKFAMVMKTGEIVIRSIEHLLTKRKRATMPAKASSFKSTKVKGKLSKKTYTHELSEMLDIGKLKRILREFGEYPTLYRKVIWTHILQLPNDEDQYNAVTKNVYESNFNDFDKNYPLEVKQDMKNLKRLLSNLVSWCPFLSAVNYLPTLVFPFTKFIHSEPVLCFETVICILVNFCQFWFEYYPVPPLNILGLVENLLIQYDLELLAHFNDCQLTSNIYAWCIMQSMFSEVLTSEEWLIFIDHIISNEPAFIIIAAAAYSIVNRGILMTITNLDDFEVFFRTFNSFDFKRFIGRCYRMLAETPNEHHPRIYLSDFQPITNGQYPLFNQYPKNCLEVCQSLNELRTEANALAMEECIVQAQNSQVKKLKQISRSSVENMRQIELNNLYQATLDEERRHVSAQRERVQNLRQELRAKAAELVINDSDSLIACNSDVSEVLSMLKSPSDEIAPFGKIEEDLLKHYTNLLKHKIQIEGLIEENASLDFIQLKKSYRELTEEINKSQLGVSLPSKEYLKQLNVATGLAAVDSLIEKVEAKIANRCTSMDKAKTKYMVDKLATESEQLSEEIGKLMTLLSK